MLIILDSNSEIGAHVWTNLTFLKVYIQHNNSYYINNSNIYKFGCYKKIKKLINAINVI